MPRLCVLVFGGFEARVRRGGALVALHFRTRKAEALIAYLALRGNGRIRRTHLCELLWGDVPEVQARHSLRQTLTDIRAILQPHALDLLVTSEDTVAFIQERVWVDARAFDRLLRHATPRSVATACRLYRGDLLDGVHIREAGFDSWANVERLAYRERAIDAYERWTRLLTDAGNTADALQAALRLTAMDPLSERAHRTLMTLYLQRGQFAAALRQYEICAEILARELGIAPDAETAQLWRQVLAARGDLAGPPAQGRRRPQDPDIGSTASRDEPDIVPEWGRKPRDPNPRPKRRP